MARVKSKRIETSICSIINIELSTPIFGLPMVYIKCCHDQVPVRSLKRSFEGGEAGKGGIILYTLLILYSF